MAQNDDRQWHLDKRVPIALMVTLAVQAVGFGYWGGSFAAETNQRLSQIERRLEGFSVRSNELADRVTEQGQDIAVLLSQIQDTNRNLDLLRQEVAVTNSLLRDLLVQARDSTVAPQR